MTDDRNWPGDIEPGGCDCHECGEIFVGSEWRCVCRVCAARGGVTREGGDANAAPSPEAIAPDPKGRAQHG